MNECLETLRFAAGSGKTGMSHYLNKKKDAQHKNLESLYTAMIARALDRFLFDDEHKTIGSVYHQIPSRRAKKKGSGEAPDIFVFMNNDKNIPSIPLLVSDWKNEKLTIAINKTHAYGATTTEVCYPETPGQVFLGLAGSQKSYKLYLYKPCNGHIDVIYIANFDVHQLLIVLHWSIYKLIEINKTNTNSPTSTCNLLVFCCEGSHEQLHDTLRDSENRVIRQACVVHCFEKDSSIMTLQYASH